MNNKNNFASIDQIDQMEKEDDYKKLIQSIYLTKEENYDCQRQNVWSYRKGCDFREGISLKYGNMVNGYPFEIDGIQFINSEAAYIAGAYSGKDGISHDIQSLIAKENNGRKCKRIYRYNPEFTDHVRKDFFEYNVQWMLYVLWQKSIGNTDFSQLLKKIPIDAHVVENTTLQTGITASFWGAKNNELMRVRKEIENIIQHNTVSFKTKKDRKEAQMLASNSINKVGHFDGTNTMGKIIKLCSLAVIFDQEPLIDYDLLKHKNIFLLGKRLDFNSQIKTSLRCSLAS
jgi:hypothetical protein